MIVCNQKESWLHMDKFELHDFNKRIKLNTNLENISKEICKHYKLGNFISNTLITIGYEDYNFYLDTSKGKFCVKIFSKERTKEDIKNYLERIKAIAKSNVSSPKPLEIDGNIFFSLYYQQNNYDICVFEFIDGKNYFELKQLLSSDVIQELAKQTALINNLDIKPNFIYDHWAFVNFKEEYKEKRKYLLNGYKAKFDELLEEFNKINFKLLPKGFVHGDIISTNVMIDKNQKVWIIDYAVSNYLPRIIDLAVISCNMCLDKNSKDNTYENIYLLLNEYNKYNQLTNYEIENFGTFYKMANAMHILEPQYIIKTDGNSEENQYWLKEGITGLSFFDENLFKKILTRIR